MILTNSFYNGNFRNGDFRFFNDAKPFLLSENLKAKRKKIFSLFSTIISLLPAAGKLDGVQSRNC